MKQLHKIITLFIIIFFTGILVTVKNINSPLNKNNPSETVKIQKDSLKVSIKNRTV